MSQHRRRRWLRSHADHERRERSEPLVTFRGVKHELYILYFFKPSPKVDMNPFYMSNHNEPWYSDCDDGYTGCAMPIGRKAEFWRQYFLTNLHIRVEYRSDQDCLLRDFAEVERRYLELTEDYGMRVTYCEFLCERTPWYLRFLRRISMQLKAIPNVRRKGERQPTA